MKRVQKIKQEKQPKKSKVVPKYEEMSLSDAESTVVAGISAALAVPVAAESSASAKQSPEVEETGEEQEEVTASPKEMAKLAKRLKALEEKENEEAVPVEKPVPSIPLEDYMKLRKRVKLLEGKFKRAHSLSEYVTPLEVVDVAGKLIYKKPKNI